MSLFDKDIVTNDLSWMSDGRDWMIDSIRMIENDFINGPYGQYSRICGDDVEERMDIAHTVRGVWLANNAVLKQFNIDATSTMVHLSRTKEYKYDVVVHVRFIAYDLAENYVEFIRVPIIKL